MQFKLIDMLFVFLRIKVLIMNNIKTVVRKLLLPLIILITIAACSVQKPIEKSSTAETATEDSTEYKMIVFDSGFETWYLMKDSPANTNNVEYYRNWNRQYVQAWNMKASSSRYGRFFASPINYDMQENYPIEIEKKLFYYFRYVEQELKIPILSNRIRPRD